MAKASEHLLIKSSDAVQQYIAANNFRRVPDIDNDDDGVSSVSSYVDEPDRGRLADSSLSLESEPESAYESLSEDGHGGVNRGGVRTGGRPRSYDVRTVRRDSRSRSRSRSLDRTRTYSKASVPPSRYTLHDIPVHRIRAVDPPRPYAGTAGGDDACNVQVPTLPTRFPTLPSQMPPKAEGLPDPRFGSDAHEKVASASIQRRPGATQEEQRINAGHLNHDRKAASQPTLPLPSASLPLRSANPLHPGPCPQTYPGNDRRPYMAPLMTTRMPWSLGPQPYQSMPNQQPLHTHIASMENVHQMGMPSRPPLMHSSPSASPTAPSSASSTPTVAFSSNTPPEYSSAWAPASIDYRLVIKTSSFTHTLAAMPDFRLDHAQPQEHRLIARTPPTRNDISAVALRYIHQNLVLFPGLTNVAKGAVRVKVTRAVFNAGHGREESYDLAGYAENDFTRLCDAMKRAVEEEGGRAGLPQVSGWPLFEVVMSNIGPSA